MLGVWAQFLVSDPEFFPNPHQFRVQRACSSLDVDFYSELCSFCDPLGTFFSWDYYFTQDWVILHSSVTSRWPQENSEFTIEPLSLEFHLCSLVSDHSSLVTNLCLFISCYWTGCGETTSYSLYLNQIYLLKRRKCVPEVFIIPSHCLFNSLSVTLSKCCSKGQNINQGVCNPEHSVKCYKVWRIGAGPKSMSIRVWWHPTACDTDKKVTSWCLQSTNPMFGPYVFIHRWK